MKLLLYEMTNLLVSSLNTQNSMMHIYKQVDQTSVRAS
jgi:hypothetical protein